MEYRYYITEEIRNKYFRRFPIIKSFLLEIENNTEQLNFETNIKSILIQNISINNKAMTLVWLPKYYQQYCIYILRYVNEFDDYDREVDYNSRAKFAELLSQFSISEEKDIDNFIQSLFYVDNSNNKPQLTDEENYFLDKVISFNHRLLKDEPVIYETDNWISDITSVSEGFSSIAGYIHKYVEDSYVNGKNYGWGRTEPLSGKFAVIYREDNKWILDGLKDDGFDLALGRPKPIDLKRGYPYTLLEEPIEWIKMEKISKSNLALSEEQIKWIANPIKYPLFITGRAGSGKSTALLYIFAEVMVRWSKCIKECGNDSIKGPLYLSYSKELIEDAKKLTTSLFTYNHALEGYRVGYQDDIEPHLDDIFLSFDELRKDCIKKHHPELLNTRFSKNKKISFKLFKEKWDKEFAYDRDMQKNYGANISWYIIRTYIKGWRYDSYMDVNGYKGLTRKQRQGNVGDNTFRVVYEKVWEKWYKQLTAEDYWDDLDIVRYCLDNNWVDERFSAIFCDEAQDFTRVEIDFILRLSSFTNRKYDSTDYIQKLPFAFAGDEFQTLSPTGFSWESIRGYFIDRLFELTGLNIENDDVKKSLPESVPFFENYRSEPEIVKTANRIQLLRAARFDNHSIPQKPHFVSGDDLCYRVPLKADFKVWDNVTSEYEIAIIVPKDENESYEDYICRTGDLKNYILEEKNPKVEKDPKEKEHKKEYKIKDFITMLTPSSAKGGEYPNVLLYGFGKEDVLGDLTVDRLLQWFIGPKKETNKDTETNKDIELENLICNMYVALTRATKHVYIIDDFSNDSIWSFLFGSNKPNNKMAQETQELQRAMIEHLGNKKDEWEKASNDNLLGWVYDISEKEISKMSFTTISEEERLKMYNEYRRSYFRNEESACLEELRQLANQFNRLRKRNEYYGCLADADRKEGKYNEAANNYFKAKEYLNALDTYWIGLSECKDSKEKERIISEISKLDEYLDDSRAVWCAKLTKGIQPKDFEVLLSDLLIETTKVVSSIAAWDVLLSYAFEIVNNQDPLGSEICSYDKILKIIEELKGIGIEIDLGKLAYMAYHYHAEDDAIRIWEHLTGTPRPNEYYSLKWKKTDYPENLQYAKEMGDSSWSIKVIDLYKQNRNNRLTEKQRNIIYEAFLSNKNLDDYNEYFLEILMSRKDADSCIQFVKEAISVGVNINPDLFTGYILLWLEDGRDWKAPEVKYQKETMLLFDAVSNIMSLRKKDFISSQLKSIRDNLDKEDVKQEEVVIPFCDNYEKYINTPIGYLVFIELGKAFEKADIEKHWLSAAIYYKWIEEKVDDSFLKEEMSKRWVYCREKQANITSNEVLKSRYLSEANNKRKKLGIEGELLSDLSFNNENWKNLFSLLMTIDTQVEDKSEEAVEEQNDDKMSISIVSPNNQVITYSNYHVIIIPQRGNIVIREDETQCQTIIMQGVFKEDDYYMIMDDGRIFNKVLDKETPFMLKITNHEAILSVFDGFYKAGFSIHINI